MGSRRGRRGGRGCFAQDRRLNRVATIGHLALGPTQTEKDLARELVPAELLGERGVGRGHTASLAVDKVANHLQEHTKGTDKVLGSCETDGGVVLACLLEARQKLSIEDGWEAIWWTGKQSRARKAAAVPVEVLEDRQ